MATRPARSLLCKIAEHAGAAETVPATSAAPERRARSIATSVQRWATSTPWLPHPSIDTMPSETDVSTGDAPAPSRRTASRSARPFYAMGGDAGCRQR